MFRRVIGPLVAVFLVAQSFWFVAPVRAQTAGGTLKADHTGTNTFQARRVSEDELVVSARVQFREDGYIDDILCYLTIHIYFGGQKDNRWALEKIKYGNVQTDSGSCVVNATEDGIVVKNKRDQTVLPALTTSNPPVSNYGAIVDPDKKDDNGNPQVVLVGNFGKESESNSSASGDSDAPLNAFASAMSHVAAAVHIENYDLKNTGGGVKYTKADVVSWFNNKDVPGLKITIFEEKGQPPKVFVGKKALEELGGTPPGDLTFKLVAHSGEGAIGVEDKDWLTFEAYLGEELVKNLFLLVSDNLDANFVYGDEYSTFKKGQYGGDDIVGRVIAGEGDDFADSLSSYFTYTMNIPLNSDGTVGGDNCGQGIIGEDKKIATTGPKDKNVVPTPDNNRTTDIGVDGDDARELSYNCANISSNGWLKYWGVKDLFISTPGESSDGCGLADIFKAGDIGKIFSKMTECLFNSIFKPMVEWATELVIKAAGITYYQPEIGDRWRA